jgi:hypothetical protein
MKRCPQCYQVYENTERFCEVDGQSLLDDPAVVATGNDRVSQSKSGYFAIGLIGVLSGVFLCCVAYLGYSLLTLQTDSVERDRRQMAAQVSEPVEIRRPAPVRVVDAAPTPTETPSPEEAEASPEPSQPAPVEQASRHLNQGPISTGEQATAGANAAEATTIIEMTDGSIIEVDAAWKDDQGVWYRRGGLVSFVESLRVKSITSRAESKTSPAKN